MTAHIHARKRESGLSDKVKSHDVLNPSAFLSPSQIAFLGECESAAPDNLSETGALFVQILCWSCTPTAWQVLLHSWESMQAYCNDVVPGATQSSPVESPPDAWIHAVAPRLGRPFHEAAAKESTLAALIARAEIAFAVSIIDKSPPRAGRQGKSLYRIAVPEFLTGYLRFLTSCGYQPCQMVIAGAHDVIGRDGLRSAFKLDRRRFQGPRCTEPLQLRFCPPGEEPLPLELANLASAAVVRHLTAPKLANPIFEEVRSKLAKVPRRIATEPLRKRH